MSGETQDLYRLLRKGLLEENREPLSSQGGDEADGRIPPASVTSLISHNSGPGIDELVTW
ncbi:hypothetical protein SNOG_05384 [Parastagonospora nodorum SN15]|uniref:Uncharacterized protein n=1 Tax=Phaeosphaeria nodorum (strain SN15 / ATCC MYA-4574 / FGSC 10173) TaxID=321614 RepID=Q0US80_PHANO|nr:hypothetical protein SNOG_05384 [Parastagonospora nodorum SN15]EAT87775.1 hypothetical protein SNOG_05384 [Parastagonospora nodorum SN15]